MPRYILFLALLWPSFAFSQKYFDKNRDEVKKELEKYISTNKNINPVLSETDTTLIITVNETQGKTTRFIYEFDRKTGKCSIQRTAAGCDSCYKKYLENLLAQKEYGWKKLNGNQYVSKFSSHLLLELPLDESEHTFTLFRASWSKELYDILIKN